MSAPARHAPALALHGGAGALDPAAMAPSHRRAAVDALRGMLARGVAALDAGAAALDVVESVVVELEDCELFNAGRGAVLDADGAATLDAAIADGRGRRAGAVAVVRTLRNPVRAARAVLEDGAHVMLVGEGAERFAASRGLVRVEPAWFVTDARRTQLEAARREGRVSLDHDERFRDGGTVGAVARDRHGHLAAATSTGGMTNKHPGRVGDSPLIGAGTFADDAGCAVSATGHGEYFLRAVVAHDVHARMRYAGRSLADAADHALAAVAALGGRGGLIAVAGHGDPVLRHDTPGMYRAWRGADGALRVAIGHDPED